MPSKISDLPSWIRTEEQKSRVYASPAGWMYDHPNGNQELLLAKRNLSNLIDDSSAYSTGTYIPTELVIKSASLRKKGSDLVVRVAFDEKYVFANNTTLTVSPATGSWSNTSGGTHTISSPLVFTASPAGNYSYLEEVISVSDLSSASITFGSGVSATLSSAVQDAANTSISTTLSANTSSLTVVPFDTITYPTSRS